MWVSEITEEHLQNEMIDRILFDGIEDRGEAADCIIVLGSIKASKYRVPVAVEAYRAGRANCIMLCGGSVREFPEGRMTEACNMYQRAIELGAVQASIILEETSQNTIENMLCALLELQRSMWLNKVKRVLLVTTTYHMRRSLQLARYLFPDHIEVCPCPADDESTRRTSWMNTEVGIHRARTEVMKIVEYVNNGVIPDFEV